VRVAVFYTTEKKRKKKGYATPHDPLLSTHAPFRSSLSRACIGKVCVIRLRFVFLVGISPLQAYKCKTRAVFLWICFRVSVPAGAEVGEDIERSQESIAEHVVPAPRKEPTLFF
jgi:hypothetical protein